MDEPTEIRNEHFSHAGFYIAFGLLKHLQRKGALTREEVTELMDGALLSLEEPREQDDIARGTRAVLEELLEDIRAAPGGPKAPSYG
jgi:hypothetical protein